MYFLLTADLDLSGHNWTPVGTYSETPADRRPFEGYFDGDFHTISNLTISTESDYQGLFGFIDNDRAYYSTPSVSSLIVKNPDLEQTGKIPVRLEVSQEQSALAICSTAAWREALSPEMIM